MKEIDIKKRIQAYTFMDDDFMSFALDNNIECVQTILRILLKKDIQVISCHTQDTIPFLKHSVRLDIVAMDRDGKVYNIEMQNKKDEYLPKRMRYSSSMLDMNYLDKNEEYETLPETYIIFLMRSDFFKKKEPIYEFSMRESKHGFEDGSQVHHLYVNVKHKFKEESELSNLFHDLLCRNFKKMVYDCFRETMQQIKEDEETMSTYIRSAYDEGYDNGRHQEKVSNQIQFIQSLSEMDLPINKIAQAVKLTEDEVRIILKENKTFQDK